MMNRLLYLEKDNSSFKL